jgi:hypothetical protein
MKMGYAFLWQEFFIPITFAYGWTGLTISSYETPLFNKIVNLVSGIEQVD